MDLLEQARQLVPNNALINGVRVAYGVHGDGDPKDNPKDDPVVLLHGTPSSSFIWRNIVPALVAANHTVYVYDLLGYGLSERPWDKNSDTSVSGQVPILVGLLHHWGLQKFHLVAHDIGGAIAQRLAVFEQHFLKTLTLIDTVSFDSWPSKRTHQQMQAGLEVLVKKPDEEHRQHFTEWLYSTVQNKQQLQDNALALYLDYISGEVGQGSFFYHQVSHYHPKHTDELTPHLSTLGNIPVQLIWGENDGWQVVDWAHKLNAAIPHSQLHVLPDCGHFAMEDKPAEIAQLIRAFIKP